MKTFLTGQRLLALAALCLSALCLCSPSLAAPTVSLSAPANGTSYLAPASIALSASATPSSGTTIKKVEFYRGRPGGSGLALTHNIFAIGSNARRDHLQLRQKTTQRGQPRTQFE